MTEELVGRAADLPPGSVVAAGGWAVLNVDGRRYAVSRHCRHLRADLSGGEINADGCLVCPWHHAEYDPSTGRMTKGPQGGFEKVPGLGTIFKGLTKVAPLGTAKVIERDGNVYVDA